MAASSSVGGTLMSTSQRVMSASSIGLGGDGDHILAQLVERLVNAGRVEKEVLGVGSGKNTEQLVAGRLGLGRGDGDLLAQQAIEKGGFAGIRAADHGDEAAAMIGPRLSSSRRTAVGAAGSEV